MEQLTKQPMTSSVMHFLMMGWGVVGVGWSEVRSICSPYSDRVTCCCCRSDCTWAISSFHCSSACRQCQYGSYMCHITSYILNTSFPSFQRSSMSHIKSKSNRGILRHGAPSRAIQGIAQGTVSKGMTVKTALYNSSLDSEKSIHLRGCLCS